MKVHFATDRLCFVSGSFIYQQWVTDYRFWATFCHRRLQGPVKVFLKLHHNKPEKSDLRSAFNPFCSWSGSLNTVTRGKSPASSVPVFGLTCSEALGLLLVLQHIHALVVCLTCFPGTSIVWGDLLSEQTWGPGFVDSVLTMSLLVEWLEVEEIALKQSEEVRVLDVGHGVRES